MELPEAVVMVLVAPAEEQEAAPVAAEAAEAAVAAAEVLSLGHNNSLL